MSSFLSVAVLLAVAVSMGSALRGVWGRSARALQANLGASTTTLAPSTAALGKLPWKPEGYNTWLWKSSHGGDYKINYVDFETAENKNKPPLLLIHGFGASCYHWRYNIPALAKDYHVYAIDMLGFGLSQKPIINYSAEVWRDQTLAFLAEVVQRRAGKPLPAVVAGNSLGGFTALYAAASPEATAKNLINGVILLNAAGSFRDQVEEIKAPDSEFVASIKASFQRFVIGLSFIYTKQPARIAQVLRQVYPVNPAMVDDELVASIQFPAQDPNAAEVFYRVIVKNGNGPLKKVDDLLETLKVPLFLLWGKADPWIRPQAADKIQRLFPSAMRSDIDAGHCPHDEAPAIVNSEIFRFMQSVNK